MAIRRFLTGIKPTWDIHLGNYLWAIKQMIQFQDMPDTKLFMFIPNQHSLTALHDPKLIRQYTTNAIKSYLACGLDPDKSLIYLQSDVPAHAQVFWVLSCITNMGFMKRMHSYKDAVAKGVEEDLTVGTFNYPILMAVDILLYDTDFVPVWKDQKQHVEYARDIAHKFNTMFGKTFKLPEPYILADIATVPWLDGRKMSKSYNNYIALTDSDTILHKKVQKIETDTIPLGTPKNPDECNVYNIMKYFIDAGTDASLRQKYLTGNYTYKEIKALCYESISTFLKPIQNKLTQISDSDIQSILDKWAQQARWYADAKCAEVYHKVGFGL
jgi:tryptophanyl-tRNA synthetase